MIGRYPDVVYWPSFEIVRWLGPHLPRPPFAEEDGKTRHVSLWVRDLIIGLFLEYFGPAAIAADPENRLDSPSEAVGEAVL